MTTTPVSTQPILILGAQGFIGRALRRRLRGRMPLVNVDQADPGPEQVAGETNLQLDLGNPADVDAIFDHLGDDAAGLAGVIHLAAYYDFKNQPDPRYGALEDGLQHLLRRCAERLPGEVPFVYASSMAALAPTEPGEKLGPESPRSGAWAYTAHKVRCEQILETADIPHPRGELVLAGVYSDWCELVPLYQHIERIRRSSVERLFYPGPVDRGFPYLHVDDAAEAFESAVRLLRGRAGVHRYMVGEDVPIPYRDIQQTASQVLHGRDFEVLRVPKFLARQGARVMQGLASARGDRSFIKPWMIEYAGEHFELDTTKTSAELDWRPRHDMRDELPQIVARARDKPDEWLARNDARPF